MADAAFPNLPDVVLRHRDGTGRQPVNRPVAETHPFNSPAAPAPRRGKGGKQWRKTLSARRSVRETPWRNLNDQRKKAHRDRYEPLAPGKGDQQDGVDLPGREASPMDILIGEELAQGAEALVVGLATSLDGDKYQLAREVLRRKLENPG